MKQVLVLGAGASAPYDLPTGAGLRQGILDNFLTLLQKKAELRTSSGLHDLPYRKFIDNFRHSHFSIDKFTELFQNHEVQAARMANVMITTQITDAEKNASLHDDNPNTGRWYPLFWNKLNKGLSSYEKFAQRCADISIVTFNYDRSVEKFLMDAINSSFQNNRVYTEDQLPISIYHVYGRTGALANIPYGTSFELTGSPLVEGAIQLINQARQSPDHSEIVERVKICDKLLFLGFSYQRENLEILGLPLAHERGHIPTLLGTCQGISDNELLAEIIPYLDPRINPRQNGGIVNSLKSISCYQLIKEHFFVE